MENRIFR